MGLRKATAERFDSEATRLAKELGAIDHPGVVENEMLIETKGGPMTIWPSAMAVRGRRTGFYTVFCRFRDMDKLKAGSHISTAINPFSGKYNFHYDGHDSDLETALAYFKQHLRRALPKKEDVING